MTKDLIQHYSIRKLSIGAVSVIVGSFFLVSGQTVHADTMNDANSAQIQSNNNKSAEPKEIDTKQVIFKSKDQSVFALLFCLVGSAEQT